MKNVPSKIKTFVRHKDKYYVGLDCERLEEADEPMMARLLLHRMLQIKSYCKIYRKGVVVVVNTVKIPESVVKVLVPLQMEVIAVTDNDKRGRFYGDYCKSKNPQTFIAKATDVVLALVPEGSDYDIEDNPKDTPVKLLFYSKANPKIITGVDSMEVVRDYKVVKKQNNNPYNVFDLGQQGTRVQDDYYTKIMQAPQVTAVPKALRLTGS